MALGPNEVEAAADAAVAALSAVLAPSDVSGSRQEWAAAAGSLQQVIDVATAAQDAAIVRLAAIEPDRLDDGTEVETHRALGHLALDAPSILSGVLSTTAVHAERRVRAAVHLAADGPVGSDTHTGLGGLHLAMAAGRLDAYRAGVVADELEHAPAEVRASVVAALEQHFEREDGTHLRRRCRRVLARISPDLLLQRAARARAESGLRRWVDEPGVDKWEGTFPSEEAAQAWAAIDALARQYVTDGHCATIERGRAKSLTDLVAGNATITAVLTVTVPAEALPTPAGADIAGPVAVSPVPAAAPFRRANDGPERVEGRVARTGAGDLVEVTGPAAGQPVLVSGQWLAQTAQTATTEVAPCHPITGALISDDLTIGPGGAALVPDSPPGSRAGAGGDAYRPSARIAKRIRARDRRCRFPRLHRCRRVLRPRPRPPLAGRPHDRRQPALPVPTPPPHQTTTWLDHGAHAGRRRELHRSHRQGPHHASCRRLAHDDPGHPAHRGEHRCLTGQHQPRPHGHPRRPPHRARVPPGAPRHPRHRSHHHARAAAPLPTGRFLAR
ncbi:MAG: hypothetical protein ACJ715_14945 [Ornithinibacter sp.]